MLALVWYKSHLMVKISPNNSQFDDYSSSLIEYYHVYLLHV